MFASSRRKIKFNRNPWWFLPWTLRLLSAFMYGVNERSVLSYTIKNKIFQKIFTRRSLDLAFRYRLYVNMVGKRAWTCAKERIPRAFAWQLFQCIIARAAHIVTESRRVSYVSRSWSIDRWIRSARVDRIRTADHGNEEDASWIEGKGRKKRRKREKGERKEENLFPVIQVR